MKVEVVASPKPVDLDAWALKLVRAVRQVEEQGSRVIPSARTTPPEAA